MPGCLCQSQIVPSRIRQSHFDCLISLIQSIVDNCNLNCPAGLTGIKLQRTGIENVVVAGRSSSACYGVIDSYDLRDRFRQDYVNHCGADRLRTRRAGRFELYLWPGLDGADLSVRPFGYIVDDDFFISCCRNDSALGQPVGRVTLNPFRSVNTYNTAAHRYQGISVHIHLDIIGRQYPTVHNDVHRSGWGVGQLECVVHPEKAAVYGDGGCSVCVKPGIARDSAAVDNNVATWHRTIDFGP